MDDTGGKKDATTSPTLDERVATATDATEDPPAPPSRTDLDEQSESGSGGGGGEKALDIPVDESGYAISAPRVMTRQKKKQSAVVTDMALSVPPDWNPDKDEEDIVATLDRVNSRGAAAAQLQQLGSDGDGFGPFVNGSDILLGSYDKREEAPAPRRRSTAMNTDEGVPRSLADNKRMAEQQRRASARAQTAQTAQTAHAPVTFTSCVPMTTLLRDKGFVDKIDGQITTSGNVLCAGSAISHKVLAVVRGAQHKFIVQSDKQLYMLSEDDKRSTIVQMRVSPAARQPRQTHFRNTPGTETEKFSMSAVSSRVGGSHDGGNEDSGAGEEDLEAIRAQTYDFLTKVCNSIDVLAHRGMGHSRYQEYLGTERINVIAKPKEGIDWLNKRLAEATYQNLLKLAEWHKLQFPTEYEKQVAERERKEREEQERAERGGGCITS